MKYEYEINGLLRSLIHEDWMSETDYQEALGLALERSDVSKEMISNQIDTGVKNGYSVEEQMKTLKELI